MAASDPSLQIAVAVAPVADPHITQAVTAAGGVIADLADARVLIWLGEAHDMPALPETIAWVALKTAGIEQFVAAGVIDETRLWTNASGVYAENVAEHALALLLAGLRQIDTAVRTRWDKSAVDPAVRTLRGSTVAIIGAGGIADALIPRLSACGASVIAVNRSGRDVPGAAQTLPAARLAEVWPATDHVVLAAPATAETRHLINPETLAALPAHCWVVNIARGPLIDQHALHHALSTGQIAGAALDVTDPEPPDQQDPLWDLPNVIITPHVANPASGLTREFAPWVADNLRRFAAGEELRSLVTTGRDY